MNISDPSGRLAFHRQRNRVFDLLQPVGRTMQDVFAGKTSRGHAYHEFDRPFLQVLPQARCEYLKWAGGKQFLDLAPTCTSPTCRWQRVMRISSGISFYGIWPLMSPFLTLWFCYFVGNSQNISPIFVVAVTKVLVWCGEIQLDRWKQRQVNWLSTVDGPQ